MGIGFEKWGDADKISKEEIEEVSTNVPKRQPLQGISPEWTAHTPTDTFKIGYVFNFETNDVYSTFNPVNYTVYLYVSDRSIIKSAGMIFGTSNQNFSNIQIDDLDTYIEERSQLYHDAVKLYPDPERSDYFYRTGTMNFTVTRDLVLHFLYVDINDNGGVVPVGNPIVTIAPSTAKLQADANRAIINQINEERKSIKEQDETNARIESLSWFALGAIFVVLGIDVGLRYYFERVTCDGNGH